ncbi:protein of unknown function [Hathewaya proteolytica DSM 3090]|uniref:DUF4355 domain-containing protein n=1 Tax=Hathewaya proteolytica DSM 3090 TaxID=1121331 RepID=A0A1M6L174_9CLOT|nr:DUF4355 domain-containing protein [Hathewaya proteolytica]SHJ64990.1 protein of unknown function [Hathewaya proteolytica DSM 3090]
MDNIDTNIDTTNTQESSAVDSKATQEATNTNVGTNGTNVTNGTKDTQEKTITMTQEELDKIITKRLERERVKLETEKQEAEKLAKMSAEEKAKFELDKQKSDFEKERQQFLQQKMELEITKQLNTEGLPSNFAKYLMANEAETAMANIKEFKTLWTSALEMEVNKRLTGSTPKSGGSATMAYSIEDLKGMSIEDINKNWNKIK